MNNLWANTFENLGETGKVLQTVELSGSKKEGAGTSRQKSRTERSRLYGL